VFQYANARERKVMASEDKLEALHIHIAGLQAILTQRNETIERLNKKVAELEINPLNEAHKNRAYKQGWKDCAFTLKEIVRKTALELNSIDKEAFKIYLEGETND
jgi:predicted RNase H-like nuclease (RuvC/YqgF family)